MDHPSEQGLGFEGNPSSDGKKLRVVIIGGSITGLSCAHALLKSGVCTVTVLEKARFLTAAGAGLGLEQLAVDALQEWGLAEEIFSICNPLTYEENRATDRKRNIFFTLSRDDTFRHRAVHWSDLHHILYEALPSSMVQFGHEVVSVQENEDGSPVRVSVLVREADGVEPTEIEIKGDIVVAADGSMSRTRKSYFPDEHRRYSGYCAWRGVLKCADMPEIYDVVKKAYPGMGETLYFELAADTHAVLYELKEKRLNWLWYVNALEPDLKGDSVTKHPDQEVIEAMKGNAGRLWTPALAEVIKHTEKPYINAIYDKDPLSQLKSKRVVLVGEAAHPTTPHGLRSTNMSISDAYVLGKAIQKWGPNNVDAAFSEYEQERLPTTSQQVLFSRHLGQLKQGHLFGLKDLFPWPTADKALVDSLHISNMNTFQWKK